MKLELNMYVRTKHKGICRINGFASSLTDDYIENEKGSMIPKDEILEASNNIIDLIEKGDLLKCNTYGDLYIYEVCEDEEGLYIVSEDMGTEVIYLKDLDIVSIVTKEQFESMQYIIGG